jgi:hypothetical protein
MAETLGSLVDKLSIKEIRHWHLDHARKSTRAKQILRVLKKQICDLEKEINWFLLEAANGRVRLRDEKLKMYSPYDRKKYLSSSAGDLMRALCTKNLELWHLEDEVRRPGIDDHKIAILKHRIDVANQQRNDLIDEIDRQLEKALKRKKK